ncbi:MAG: pyridoxamine 5'-phosphate oxidase family protein [Deferribacteraceae bacterium]|jgi:nitroimidazol reductase NimA-like FMN-containing flavoprotein (pyridoxamine 5'-phosphate oxidase superfamily)|nr:pyridoxamine 5'-phosphate oxidase family protein [Deferribacteraceae bacterium]
MRRKEKRCTDHKILLDFLNEAKVMNLAMQTGGAPYVIPLHYVYNNDSLYFHCANEGYKIELMQKYPEVGFTINEFERTISTNANNPCATGSRYKSIVGDARAEIVKSNCNKVAILNALMAKYTGRTEAIEFKDETLAEVNIVKLAIAYMDFKVDSRG